MTVPKLRFPEFRDAGEWEEKQLKDVTSSIFDGTHQTPTYTTDGVPFYSVENLISGNKNKFISQDDYVTATSKNKPDKDDILLTRIGKIGYSQVVTWDHEFSIYVTLAIIKKSELFDSYYLHCFMQSERYQAELLKKSLLNAVPCKINMDSLRGTEVLLPTRPEQQKIADCLSSIDDRITAETQKLDTLKAHKKGLMQQLFPAEGETLPKLRFPEFRDAGEWEEKELGEISHKVMVGIASAATYAYRKSGIILFRNQNIKEGYLDDNDILFIDEDYEKSHKNKRLKAGDLLTARTGYPGITCVVPAKYEGSQSFTTLITRPNNFIINFDYLCIFINSEKGQAFFNSTKIGGGQKNVNAGSLVVMPILYPSHQEQQKIADCLSSLDELITAQTQKIDLLKLHKKGLMQQLFPSIEEVTV